MENASKALIMAATVLIGVIILSLGLYLFAYFSNYANDVEQENITNQIAQFNSQFLAFQGEDLTVYDVITLANLAKNYNQNNGFTSNSTTGYINFDASKIINNPYILGSVPSTDVYTNNGSKNDISLLAENVDEEKIGQIVDEADGHKTYKLKIYHCKIEISDITRKVSKITIID